MPDDKEPKQPQPKRARITWRETPDAGFGKPRTVHEIVTATTPAELHKNFWAQPSWPVENTRKVEIVKVEWIDK